MQNVFLDCTDNIVQNNAVNFVSLKHVTEIQDIVYTDVKEVTTEVTVIIVSNFFWIFYSVDSFNYILYILEIL